MKYNNPYFRRFIPTVIFFAGLMLPCHLSHARDEALGPYIDKRPISMRYNELREKVATEGLTLKQVLNALQTLVTEIITIRSDNIEPGKGSAILFALSSFKRFFQDENLLTAIDEKAHVFRKKLVDELLRALQKSDDMNESKRSVIDALSLPHEKIKLHVKSKSDESE